MDVSRETVRKWMAEAGLWLSRKQRGTFHQPRPPRESYGELVQIDGSEHRWFENRFQRTSDPCPWQPSGSRLGVMKDQRRPSGPIGRSPGGLKAKFPL